MPLLFFGYIMTWLRYATNFRGEELIRKEGERHGDKSEVKQYICIILPNSIADLNRKQASLEGGIYPLIEN